MIEDDDRLFFSQQESYTVPKNKKEPKNSNQIEGQSESISDVGPFSVGELLGKGGFGEVRQGTNLLTGELVALKFLKRSEISSLCEVERTANEIQCVTSLKHRNIIKLEMVRGTISISIFTIRFRCNYCIILIFILHSILIYFPCILNQTNFSFILHIFLFYPMQLFSFSI